MQRSGKSKATVLRAILINHTDDTLHIIVCMYCY